MNDPIPPEADVLVLNHTYTIMLPPARTVAKYTAVAVTAAWATRFAINVATEVMLTPEVVKLTDKLKAKRTKYIKEVKDFKDVYVKEVKDLKEVPNVGTSGAKSGEERQRRM